MVMWKKLLGKIWGKKGKCLKFAQNILNTSGIMDITGKIIAVLEPRSGVAKASGNPWKIQEYVLETIGEQYPKKMMFSIFGEDKIQQAAINIGDEVVVSFDINAREFNELRCFLDGCIDIVGIVVVFCAGSYMTDLRLDRDAAGTGVIDDPLCHLDIDIKALHGSIKHDRGKTEIHSLPGHLDGLTVIQMQDDRCLHLLGIEFSEPGALLDREETAEVALCKADDQRKSHCLSSHDMALE